MKKITKTIFIVAVIACFASSAFAEEAESSPEPEEAAPEATEAPAAEAAEAPAAEETAPDETMVVDESTPAAAAASSESPTEAREPESVEMRAGRVEMVLIENRDPESAFEFGVALLGEAPNYVRLRILLASCLMQLGRANQALEHLNRAAELTTGDPGTHLIVLYNIARAFLATDQLQQAAEAYERYAAFATSQPDLPSFVQEAQRLSRTLRARAEAAN